MIPLLTFFYLTLTLLVFRVLADHPHYSLAVDDLALVADLLNRRPYLHKPVLSSQLSVLSNCNCVSPASSRRFERRGKPRLYTNFICTGTQSARDSDRTEKVRPRL